MKRIIVAGVVAASALFAGCTTEHMEYDFISNEQLQNLEDGVYTGKVKEGLDNAEVTVTVEGGMITDVDIINILAFGWREAPVREQLPPQVIAKQSVTDIDAVSGATGSTHAFKIATSMALEQAVKQIVEPVVEDSTEMPEATPGKPTSNQ